MGSDARRVVEANGPALDLEVVREDAEPPPGHRRELAAKTNALVRPGDVEAAGIDL